MRALALALLLAASVLAAPAPVPISNYWTGDPANDPAKHDGAYIGPIIWHTKRAADAAATAVARDVAETAQEKRAAVTETPVQA